MKELTSYLHDRVEIDDLLIRYASAIDGARMGRAGQRLHR